MASSPPWLGLDATLCMPDSPRSSPLSLCMLPPPPGLCSTVGELFDDDVMLTKSVGELTESCAQPARGQRTLPPDRASTPRMEKAESRSMGIRS
eukprot:2213490-Rhodomonas_salina.2